MAKLIATHSGPFHADDLFAYCMLQLKFNDVQLVRTRDQREIDGADIVFDVGAKYEPGAGRFDHHFAGASRRLNGIQFSSAGLIWSEFGHDIVAAFRIGGVPAHNNDEVAAQVKKVWKKVDDGLVQLIDAADTGCELATGYMSDLRPITLSAYLSICNPGWDEKQELSEFDKLFVQTAHNHVMPYLKRQIEAAWSSLAAEHLVKTAFASDQHRKEVLILSPNCPWQETVLGSPEMSDVLYVVYQAPDKNWMVQCVPDKPNSFGKRKALPAAWAGLRNKELADLIGVRDAVFCHPNLFIGGAKSREGAVTMAELAVKA
jgi:uncharacterized UPF0160 family protein